MDLPWGEALALLDNLPPDAAYWRSVGGVVGAAAGWSVEAELLVDVMHQQTVIQWARAGRRGPRPRRSSTPWTTAAEAAREAEVITRLADWRVRQQQRKEAPRGD